MQDGETCWRYLGEGNRSVVLAHSRENIVLKFLKFPVDTRQDDKALSNVAERLRNMIDYTQQVMKSLIGPAYVHCGELAEMPTDLAKRISAQIHHFRPASRHGKTMDVWSGFATRLPNLTRLQPPEGLEPHADVLCIEIKPKCGFLPTPCRVRSMLKQRVCRYCMHQYLKVTNGKCKKVNRYCPLDLYSGDVQRMEFAIRGLLENPQNNLRVFKNGELIFGCRDERACPTDLPALAAHLRPFFASGPDEVNEGGENVIGMLVAFLVHALLHEPNEQGDDIWQDDALNSSGYFKSTTICTASQFGHNGSRNGCSLSQDSDRLPPSCVLARVRRAQCLDLLDIEGVHPLYLRLQQHILKQPPQSRFSLRLDQPYDGEFLQVLQDKSTFDDGSLQFAVRKIQQYLVSMTAKDVSIMIACAAHGNFREKTLTTTTCQTSSKFWPPATLSVLPSLPTSTAKLSLPRLRFSVSVLDLDPKPLEKVAHHWRQDRQILECYNAWHNKRLRSGVISNAGQHAEMV
uniref:Inositol-pentakisphosphate 2-kinase n=2 Tax=Eptatretus burgeri TaxID=7764 RepID=A0A8C4QVS8_EPTBU